MEIWRKIPNTNGERLAKVSEGLDQATRHSFSLVGGDGLTVEDHGAEGFLFLEATLGNDAAKGVVRAIAGEGNAAQHVKAGTLLAVDRVQPVGLDSSGHKKVGDITAETPSRIPKVIQLGTRFFAIDDGNPFFPALAHKSEPLAIAAVFGTRNIRVLVPGLSAVDHQAAFLFVASAEGIGTAFWLELHRGWLGIFRGILLAVLDENS